MRRIVLSNGNSRRELESASTYLHVTISKDWYSALRTQALQAQSTRKYNSKVCLLQHNKLFWNIADNEIVAFSGWLCGGAYPSARYS